MSSFSEINIKSNNQVKMVELSKQSLNNILAVMNQNSIIFYDINGNLIEGKSIQKKVAPCCMEWHPNQKVLAIGWKNGCITIYSDETSSQRDEGEVHKNEILILRYNPQGTRMITCDVTGLVCVWRGMTCLSKYQRSGLINHCCFAELNIDPTQKLGNLFFFGGQQGVVTLADDCNHLSEICKVGGSIAALQFYSKQNSVIIISSSLLLVQFRISTSDKQSAPEKKVKLSIAGDVETLRSIFIGDCLLATSSTENMIRFWHLDEDENYVLTMFDQGGTSDKIQHIKYEQQGNLIVAGTTEGRIVFWKNKNEKFADGDSWSVVKSNISGDQQVQQISIGNGVIAVQYPDQIKLILETEITAKIFEKVKAIQLNSHVIMIYMNHENKNYTYKFTVFYNIKGFDLQNKKLLVWNGTSIEIYEILFDKNDINMNLVSTIIQSCKKAFFSEQNLLTYNQSQIDQVNYQGNVKQSISFSEQEGFIMDVFINQNFMYVFSSKNSFKTYDISRREFKQFGITRKFEDGNGKSLGVIQAISGNKIGNRLTIIAKDKKSYLYDSEIDSIQFISENSNKIIWDKNDDRFFAVQKLNPQASPSLETYFYSSENGIKQLDTYEYTHNEQEVFQLQVPNIYYIVNQNESYQIIETLMKDFQGLEIIDDIIISAIMNFNYYLSIGNLDEAYKSVKQVQNPLIWENMAQMCVKTNRLDVAEICIGNMRFARGAKAVREAKKEKEYQAQLAMVAIQLNMQNEAQKLYQECKRFDLQNKMKQASGDWQEALEIAENNDRINLKNTYFNAARLLETQRNFEMAIDNYEKSGTYVKEIPRMFLQAGEINQLNDYIQRKDDKQLYQWWAQYQESLQNYEEASKYYKLSDDFASLVQLMINQNDLDSARKFCLQSNSTQASYTLAKQLEIQGVIQEAINFYAKAQHYSHAVRLARELQMDSEIMSLSLMALPRCINQSAEYFENKGFNEKAIILYMKSKNIKKALNLAVKSKLYDYIQKITQNIGEDEDMEVLAQVAEYFITNNQFDKAIHLLLASKQMERALDIFIQNNIPITDEIAAKILPKEIDENDQKTMNTIKTIADKSKKQGNFELAARLYRQLKDNVKAMKCMCKLNETEKIINFAVNARNQEIYIIAANYLQSADWHSSPDIMKNIISFYTRAKSYDRLAQFYDTCAGLEIDEYKDYKKAIMALKDSAKFWQKANVDDKAQQVSQRIFLIEKYLQAIELEQSNPSEMIKQLQSLAQNPICEQAIRIGDLFSPMIEFFYSQKNYEQAYTYLKTLQEKQINLHLFLNKEIVVNILNAMGIKQQTPTQRSQQQNQNQSDDEVFEEEDINEDIM